MTLQEIKDYVKTLKGTSVPQRPIEYIEYLLSEVASLQAHAADCESMRYQIRDIATDSEMLAAENKELKKELKHIKQSFYREISHRRNDV